MKRFLPLFLTSFLILFLELLIIRLIGTEIRIFAYLSNLTLLSIFVGSGIGMFLKKKVPLESSSFLLFILVLAVTASYIVRLPTVEFKLFSGITELLSPLSEDYIWLQVHTVSKLGILIGFFLTTALVLLLSLVFVPLGQFLGKLFDAEKHPLRAYSVNVLASIAGMWAFWLLSYLRLSPLAGIIIGQILLLFLLRQPLAKYFALAILAVTLAVAVPKTANNPWEGPVNFWSPYQKLTLSPIRPVDLKPEGYYLEVNNVGYMGLLDLGPTHYAKVVALAKERSDSFSKDYQFTDQYTLPYIIHPQAKSVLIVGAGAGNDAAGAIRAKVPAIDAVEIDPVVVDIGRKYHLERPYNNERVNIIVDDGRAYFDRTSKKYDLIIMGLADSHTLSSSLTNLRLDNYLYTIESLSRARSLLTDNGLLVLDFEITRPWIGGHLQQTVTKAFGYPPTIFEVRSNGYFGWGGFVFLASKDPGRVGELVNQTPGLSEFIKSNSRDFPKAEQLSDNWPYLYFPDKRIPLIHLVIAAIVVFLLLALRVTVMTTTRFYWDFFFLGAAFLLYEFQNITKTSLLFGSTWVTNLFTITAILLLILLANFVVSRFKFPIKIVFLFLALSIGIQIFTPIEIFNTFPYVAKLVFAPLFLNLPLFFAAIIFARKFTSQTDRSGAFASNLIGSAIGGFAEILSFALGINALLIFCGLLYAAAYLYSKDK